MRTVKICPMGDSLTEGDGNGSAYRYALFRYLYEDGVDFAFVGGQKSGDIRLPERYAHHAGYCGYLIGDDALEPGNSLRAVLAQARGEAAQGDVFIAQEDNDTATLSTAEAVRQADIILLLIGTNDFGHNRDLDRITERYDRLLETLFTANPTVTVYAGVDYDHYGYPPDDKHMSLVRHLLELDTDAYRAAHGWDLRIVDLCEPGSLRQTNAYADRPLDDGHPMPRGNEKLARIWEAAILPQVRRLNAQDGVSLPVKAVTGIEADLPETLALRPCEGKCLHAVAVPQDATVPTLLWSSTYPAVASVDDYGIVTAHEGGTTRIYATTLDGHFTAQTTVFVAGRPIDRAAGMDEVFADDFSDPAHWTGDTDCSLKTHLHEFYAYWKEPDGHIAARQTVSLRGRMWMEFTHQTANGKWHDDNLDGIYTQVRVGNIALRFLDSAAYICLLENGQPLGFFRDLPHAAVHQVFGLDWQGHTLTLYRDNEAVLTVTTASVPAENGGEVGIDWQKSNIQNRLFDLRIYTAD